MDLDVDEFSYSLSEAPFDINNENTWLEGMIPVAKLFYNLIEDLINKSKIDVNEIENLKTKEYTKSIFKATDYPAIANNVDDNRGNSVHKRDVSVEFDNELVGVVFDRFGTDIPIVKKDEEHFACRVKVAVSPHFLSWIMSFRKKAKIISPDYVVEEMYQLARDITKIYEK